MVARDRDEEGESRRGSRRPRDEDEVEYTARERRQGRTRKNVCKANATERDGEARFQSGRGSRNGAFDGDGREGQDPPTQESRPLFGFKQGKGCKICRELEGRKRERERKSGGCGRAGSCRDGERIRKEPGGTRM